MLLLELIGRVVCELMVCCFPASFPYRLQVVEQTRKQFKADKSARAALVTDRDEVSGNL